MRKRQAAVIRYICPGCAAVYLVPADEPNSGEPRCLRCDSPLIKSRG